ERTGAARGARGAAGRAGRGRAAAPVPRPGHAARGGGSPGSGERRVLPRQGAPGRALPAPRRVARRAVGAGRAARGRGRRGPAAGAPAARRLSEGGRMSIERTGPGSATDAARARDDASGPREAREPAPREQTDRFRDALEHARHRAGPAAQPGGDAGAAEGEAGDGATLREGARADAVHRARDGGGEGGGNSGQDAADAEARLLDPALAWQAQHALRGDAPLAAPAAVGASNAV